MKNKRRLWWTITVAYILLIYSTLGIVPKLWYYLSNVFWGEGILLQYIIYLSLVMGCLGYLVFIKRERSIRNYLIFILFLGLFLVMYKLEKNPGEKIHMLEYAILGALLYKSLSLNYPIFEIRLYVYGSFLCVVIGATDEIIQGILPNRVFTWHDVFVNGLSGIISLLYVRFHVLVPETIPSSIKRESDF